MPVTGKRQIQHEKMPKDVKRRFKNGNSFFDPVDSRI
jgi:hypothetical protein